MDSSAGNIPERMLRNGRGPDPSFEPDEQLFRRCKKDQVSDDAKLYPVAIGYKNWSVNRGKYSEPEDVLVPDWPLWGIAVFLVNHFPSAMKSAQGTNVFDFKPVHTPLERNYSHSEVVTFKNGQLATDPDPPPEVKKKYRQMLSDSSRVVKVPEV